MLVLPFGFLAGAAGGAGPAVGGYDIWIDLADTSVMSLSGTNLLSIDTKTDTGRSTYTFTNRDSATYNIEYDAANKRIDGINSSLDYFLQNATIGDDLFFPGGSEIYTTYEQTLVTITSEASFRGQPFGWEGNSRQLQQTFFNDSVGRRDGQFMSGQSFVSGITNDDSKSCLIFNTIYNNAISGVQNWRIFYRGATELSGGTVSWNTPPGSSGGDFSKLGGTSRNADTFYGFYGYIYAILHYPFALTTQQRSDLTDWAVTYYGLTLQ